MWRIANRWNGIGSTRSRAIAVGAALLLAALPAPAQGPEKTEAIGVGALLPAVTLSDQHGEAHAVDASRRALLFSRDMDGGGVIRALLEPDALDEPATAFLERHGAVCVADVHRMPSLVRRIIAKPRMRKRPYPLLLDEQGDATAAWPSREGHATLIRLDGLRVVEVLHTRDPASLRDALAAP
jgi:hypothetical protein